MKRVYQTNFGKSGNCFQACVASVLELELVQVPDFVNDSKTEWFSNLRDWLKNYNLGVVNVDFTELSISDITQISSGFCIAQGQKPNRDNVKHAVVMNNVCLSHDPLPDGEGLEIVEQVMFFIPFNPVSGL